VAFVADEIEIRALTGDDDLDGQLDLSERAFGPKQGDDETTWRQLTQLVVAAGTNRAAFDHGRPVGSAIYFDMRQWWYGRPVPMAGVGGVKVAPEDRGRGIGRQVMTALLDDIAARGFPLSVLYPATMPFYRALGWELAGAMYTAEMPSRALRKLALPDLPAPAQRSGVRRVTAGNSHAVSRVIGAVLEQTRDCGPITWDSAVDEMTFSQRHNYAYLCDDGFTWYKWYDGNDGLLVGGVQAASAATARELWSLIASNGSIAQKIRFLTHPGDPVWQLTVEQDIDIRSSWNWMLRVVDAPAAIAARGFPGAVSIDVPLSIVDQHRPANAGGWMLTVADGKGELTRHEGNGDALTLGARGLAALYAGTSVPTLRIAGLAQHGDPAADAALDAAFRATPYLLDSF
jgi:predicted acetyltransferase